MESLISAGITVLSVILLGIFTFIGYKIGFKIGFKEGRRDAVSDLVSAKDPEAWDKAHFLEIEGKVKTSIEETTKRIARKSGTEQLPR